MTKRKRSDPDYKAIRRHPVAAVSLVMQRMVLRLAREKLCVQEIEKKTKLNKNTIESIIDQGIVTPSYYSDPIRCPQCGAKVITTICMACEVRSLPGR